MVLFFSIPQSPSQNRLQRSHWSKQTCLGQRAPHPHSCLVKLDPTAGCFVPYLRSSVVGIDVSKGSRFVQLIRSVW